MTPHIAAKPALCFQDCVRNTNEIWDGVENLLPSSEDAPFQKERRPMTSRQTSKVEEEEEWAGARERGGRRGGVRSGKMGWQGGSLA